MKKIKGIICAVGFVLCGFVLGACGTSVEAKQDKPLKIWFENEKWEDGNLPTCRRRDRSKLYCRVRRTLSKRYWYSNYTKIKS